MPARTDAPAISEHKGPRIGIRLCRGGTLIGAGRVAIRIEIERVWVESVVV